MFPIVKKDSGFRELYELFNRSSQVALTAYINLRLPRSVYLIDGSKEEAEDLAQILGGWEVVDSVGLSQEEVLACKKVVFYNDSRLIAFLSGVTLKHTAHGYMIMRDQQAPSSYLLKGE